MASLATLVMWLPQLLHTFRARDGGNLSLVMLLIQMPGNLASAFFQAIVEQNGVTSFGPYLVSAIMQFALIMMIIFFYCKKRRRKPVTSDTEADWSSSEDDDEETSLLQTDISRMADGFADDFTLGMSRTSGSRSASNSRHGSRKRLLDGSESEDQ